MSTYRNLNGVVVSLVGLEKKNRRFWIIYRVIGQSHNCVMLRDDFYRDFKIMEGQRA